MLNNKDENYEGHEESEYHFSDEEVSYEVETESPKPAPVNESKINLLNQLTRSKRMIISLGVFLVLVFIVYKMVVPTDSSVPPSEVITPVTVSQEKPVPKNLTPEVPKTQQNQEITANAAAQAGTPMQGVTSPQAMPASVVAQAPPPTPQPSEPISNAVPPTNMPAQSMATEQPQAPLPQQAMPQQMTSQQPPALPQQQPSVVVSNNVPPGAGTPPTPLQSSNEQPSAAGKLQAANDQLMGQIQADYTQKINDFTTQNKATQDQLQTLNSRVAMLETQLNQLIQALTRQSQSNATSNSPPPSPVIQSPTASDPKIPYNVQAIIPGRAWLRSDSGETVTVAEGDTVKDLGRVTKIDPYDGVVEINTGSRVISLSYGNGG